MRVQCLEIVEIERLNHGLSLVSNAKDHRGMAHAIHHGFESCHFARVYLAVSEGSGT